jgi:hypothetical protein
MTTDDELAAGLALKANIASPTFTGTATVENLTVTGDFTGPSSSGLSPVAVSHTDSPVTAEPGKFYLVDISSDNVVINFPAISEHEEDTIGVQVAVAGDGKKVTIFPNGSETLNGASQVRMVNEGSWHILNSA